LAIFGYFFDPSFDIPNKSPSRTGYFWLLSSARWRHLYRAFDSGSLISAGGSALRIAFRCIGVLPMESMYEGLRRV
jgi:hypothetical protein